MKIALWSRIFPERRDWERLPAELSKLDADLVVLPEIPLNPWAPAHPMATTEDEEPDDGPRQQAMSRAARQAGIALLGGAIVTTDNVRHNTAILYGRGGTPLLKYRKVHLPSEEGFYEDRHYRPGQDPPTVCRDLELPLGVQICSDTNRPVGSAILQAKGAQVILIPRATETGTWERWKLVFRALALTTNCYILSVNRPGKEFEVPLGGPSIAIAPDGEILAESTRPVTYVDLDVDTLARAKREYPGYLATYPATYAKGFQEISEQDG